MKRHERDESGIHVYEGEDHWESTVMDNTPALDWQWSDPSEWRSSNQAHDDPFAILGNKDLGILQQVANILLSDASKHHPRHSIPGFVLPLKIPISIRVTNYPPS